MSTQSPTDENGARRVTPQKFAHAVLATKTLKPMVDWYITVLCAEVVHSNEMLAFLTYDDEHHRIASSINRATALASIISHTPMPISAIWFLHTND